MHRAGHALVLSALLVAQVSALGEQAQPGMAEKKALGLIRGTWSGQNANGLVRISITCFLPNKNASGLARRENGSHDPCRRLARPQAAVVSPVERGVGAGRT